MGQLKEHLFDLPFTDLGVKEGERYGSTQRAVGALQPQAGLAHAAESRRRQM